MKTNKFVYCKNRFEVFSKTAFKGKDVDILFCILDGEIYVFQRFKMINISLRMFAESMNIDLRVAQAIVSGEKTTIEEAKSLFEEKIDEAESLLEEKIDKAVELAEDKKDSLENKLEDKKDSLENKLEDEKANIKVYAKGLTTITDESVTISKTEYEELIYFRDRYLADKTVMDDENITPKEDVTPKEDLEI